MDTTYIKRITHVPVFKATQLFPIVFVLLWSSGAIFIKLGLNYTDPYTFLLLRLILATLFMMIVSLITKVRWPTNKTIFAKIVLTGLLMQFCYLTSYFCAVSYGVSPSILAIILGLQPILTAALLSFNANRFIDKHVWLGLFLGLIGVILIVVKSISIHSMSMIGLMLGFICVTSITLGSLLQSSNSDVDLLASSAIQFGAGVLPTFVLALLFGNFTIPLNPVFLFSLGWMVFIVSVGATLLYYFLLKKDGAISVTNLFYLVPPVIVFLCHFVFGEALSSYLVFGTLLIVIGLVVTNK